MKHPESHHQREGETGGEGHGPDGVSGEMEKGEGDGCREQMAADEISRLGERRFMGAEGEGAGRAERREQPGRTGGAFGGADDQQREGGANAGDDALRP